MQQLCQLLAIRGSERRFAQVDEGVDAGCARKEPTGEQNDARSPSGFPAAQVELGLFERRVEPSDLARQDALQVEHLVEDRRKVVLQGTA